MDHTLKKWITHDEGRKPKPYVDTVGKISIGIGRNLTDNGLSQDEIDYLFANDYKRVEQELAPHKWYTKQPEGVRNALFNMCFNMGINRLLGFKKMIAALDNRNYTIAAIEALNSKWAKQVGQRAKDIAAMIRDGK